jgi:superfamily II DNA/RNA helicase
MEADIHYFKNFNFPEVNSTEELDLKPLVHLSIEKKNLQKHFLVIQTLPLFLHSRNIFIVSPAATGKGELLSIAVHQMVNEPVSHLQFLMIVQIDYLVKETFESLHNFLPEAQVQIGFCDHSTDLAQDFQTFQTNQVVISNTKKCSIVLKKMKKKLESLRFVILNVFDPKFQMNQDILNSLNFKAPQARYWVFTKMCERTPEEEEFFSRKLENLTIFKMLRNHQDVRILTHHFTVARNESEKVFYLRKILEFNRDCQKVIFYHPQKDPSIFLQALQDFQVVHLMNEQDRSNVIDNFNKKMFSVLITPGKQFFSRKIKSQGYLYIIITDMQNKEVYETLCRRGGCQTNDRIFSMITGNDEIESIQELSNFYKIQISPWPNENDG